MEECQELARGRLSGQLLAVWKSKGTEQDLDVWSRARVCEKSLNLVWLLAVYLDNEVGWCWSWISSSLPQSGLGHLWQDVVPLDIELGCPKAFTKSSAHL